MKATLIGVSELTLEKSNQFGLLRIRQLCLWSIGKVQNLTRESKHFIKAKMFLIPHDFYMFAIFGHFFTQLKNTESVEESITIIKTLENFGENELQASKKCINHYVNHVLSEMKRKNRKL